MSLYMAFIMKVTRACPLRCSYCNDWRADGRKMSFSVLAHLIVQALHHPTLTSAEFIWHGGEPLLLGRDFFKKALYLQSKARRPDQKIVNVIQSNGLLLDESWIDFLQDHDISVGLSLDGPRELQDSQRTTVSGRGSFDDTMRALYLLRERQIGCSVAVVVTKRTLEYGPDKMLDFLLENGIENVAFLRQEPKRSDTGESDFSSGVRGSDYRLYMQGLFDNWYQRDDANVRIRNFDSIFSGIIADMPFLCTSCGDCIGQFFGVNLNGDIFHCDRYAMDPDSRFRLGNILTNSFDEIVHGKALQGLRTWNEDRVLKCRDCHWYSMCHGGCPCRSGLHRTSIDTNQCEKGKLIEHVCKRLSAEVTALERYRACLS